MIGDVWLCSGQSNMEMPVGSWGKVLNYEKEIKDADYDNIRYFNADHYTSNQPLNDLKQFKPWRACSPETVGDFSAVAYFFTRKIYNETGIPLGIVHASYQGTAIESWVSRDAFTSDLKMRKITDSIFSDRITWEEMKRAYEKSKTSASKPFRPQDAPTVLYNAMIHPLKYFPIKGILWYQGENNVGRASQYSGLFKTLIKDWRNTFENAQLPFYFVQLANYRDKQYDFSRSHWAELREAQGKALSLTATAMAVTIDIGEANNVHPKNKQEVGYRFALIALAKTYKKNIEFSGPVYDNFKIRGNKVVLSFRHNKRLQAKSGGLLSGFAIAGKDKKFYWANAKIKNKRVVLYNREVANPIAVRYAWADNPDASLYNSAQLPAAPFRTDDW